VKEAAVTTRLIKGDRVRVITGRERGKEGNIMRVVTAKATVVIEGLNLVKKATKPNQQNQKGGLIEKEAGIAISNVMAVCPRCNKPTRIGIRHLAEGKRLRVCRRCDEALGKER